LLRCFSVQFSSIGRQEILSQLGCCCYAPLSLRPCTMQMLKTKVLFRNQVFRINLRARGNVRPSIVAQPDGVIDTSNLLTFINTRPRANIIRITQLKTPVILRDYLTMRPVLCEDKVVGHTNVFKNKKQRSINWKICLNLRSRPLCVVKI
jgi:hypothetical protein